MKQNNTFGFFNSLIFVKKFFCIFSAKNLLIQKEAPARNAITYNLAFL